MVVGVPVEEGVNLQLMGVLGGTAKKVKTGIIQVS